MKGKNIRRLDESVSCVTALVYFKQYDSIIRQEKGYLPAKLVEARNGHINKTALESEYQFSSDSSDDNKFAVCNETITFNSNNKKHIITNKCINDYN